MSTNKQIIRQIIKLLQEIKFEDPPAELKLPAENITPFKIAETLINHCEDIGDTIKPRSIKSYCAKLTSLAKKYLKEDWDGKTLEWLRNTDAVLKWISEYEGWCKTSKWNYINAITSVLLRIEDYQVEHKIYSKANMKHLDDYTEERDKNVLNDKQKANMLSWDKILDLKPHSNDRKNLVFQLVKFIPRRSGTYTIMKWKSCVDDTDDNYFVINKVEPSQMILNVYKTAKTYGRYTIDIPDDLRDSIIAYTTKHSIAEDQYIFHSKDKSKPLSKCTFSLIVSATMEDLSNKRMGTTLLRISYASWFANQGTSVAVQKKHAAMLGHSVEQLNLYKKLDVKLTD